MRSSLNKLVRVLKADKPPDKIWQESFDGIGVVDYPLELCSLKGTASENDDLCDYARVIQHLKLQPDLLHYLLPVCLNAWRIDLFSEERDSIYGGFVEHFSTALATRSDLKTILGSTEYQAVMEFMCDSILDRIDREEELSFSGYSTLSASPYRWFHAIGTFAVVFPNLNRLWSTWWSMETAGHAIGALQCISCLMYEEDNNPIFSPWTRDQGGGPPSLFGTEGFIYDQGWKIENISFLKSLLSTDYIYEALKKAASVLEVNPEKAVPNKMIHDFSIQEKTLASRIRQLPG